MSRETPSGQKKLLPIKEAAQAVPYSRDYITRLARDQKIRAKYVGRQWLIDVTSLQRYEQDANFEQAVRNRKLSSARKREREIFATLKQKHATYDHQLRLLTARSMVATFLILASGVMTGVLGFEFGVSGGVFDRLPVSYVTIVDDVVSANQSAQVVSAATGQPQTVAGNTRMVTVRSLGATEEGVLLLPSATSSTAIKTLFSDDVFVREDGSDRGTVIQIDREGEMVGPVIPFVVVPVTESSK